MKNLKILKPLISIFASLIMCLILSACQNTKASTEYGDDSYDVDSSSSTFFSDNHQINIQHDSGNRVYLVDGKRFTFAQLNDEQKKRIIELEEKMDKIERLVEIDGEHLEAWSEKMEAISEQMEHEAGEFEDTVDDFHFEEASQKFEELSHNIAKAGRNLEAKMRLLEKDMRAIQIEMPRINQQAISQLEAEAENMGRILVEIAKEI